MKPGLYKWNSIDGWHDAARIDARSRERPAPAAELVDNGNERTAKTNSKRSAVAPDDGASAGVGKLRVATNAAAPTAAASPSGELAAVSTGLAPTGGCRRRLRNCQYIASTFFEVRLYVRRLFAALALASGWNRARQTAAGPSTKLTACVLFRIMPQTCLRSRYSS